MNKDKVIKAAMWLSFFALCVAVSAMALFIGFNNARHDNYVILIIGIVMVFVTFFCAYKGVKIVLESIFGSP